MTDDNELRFNAQADKEYYMEAGAKEERARIVALLKQIPSQRIYQRHGGILGLFSPGYPIGNYIAVEHISSLIYALTRE